LWLSIGYTRGDRREEYRKCPLPRERSKVRKPRQIHDPKSIQDVSREGVKTGLLLRTAAPA